MARRIPAVGFVAVSLYKSISIASLLPRVIVPAAGFRGPDDASGQPGIQW
jgi:hypothetical protein